jgi:hypothetical protein
MVRSAPRSRRARPRPRHAPLPGARGFPPPPLAPTRPGLAVPASPARSSPSPARSPARRARLPPRPGLAVSASPARLSPSPACSAPAPACSPARCTQPRLARCGRPWRAGSPPVPAPPCTARPPGPLLGRGPLPRLVAASVRPRRAHSWPSACGPLPLSRHGVEPLRSAVPARHGFGSRGRGAPVWCGPLPVARPRRARDSFVAHQRGLASVRARVVRAVLWRGATRSILSWVTCPSTRSHRSTPTPPVYFMRVDHVIYINEMETQLRN